MPDFSELKQRQAAVWSNGRFEEVADNLRDMHGALVDALEPRAGERWLDVGCGVGSVAELAAGAGARVTGIDLAPRMIDVARARAQTGGYDIEYRVGDAESLDVDDAGVDVLVSSVGMIFAPDHAAVAREVARVVRPGGRIAFSAWTPEGSMGLMVSTLGPFQPPPPEGAGSPFQWGSEEYARERLSGAFELRMDRRRSRFEDASVQDAWEIFSTKFGPGKTLVENLDPARRPELERAMLDYFAAFVQPDGRVVDEAEYLLVQGIRR